MAKAKTRRSGRVKRAPSRRAARKRAASLTASNTVASSGAAVQMAQSPASRFGLLSAPGVFASGMVALGCLGMAYFFFFIYAEDSNHILFGGIAALMALMWALSCASRVRRARRR